jgi:hypothetical protein
VRSLENGQPLTAGPCAGKACLARDHHRADPRVAKLLALPGVTSVAAGGFAREGWTCVTTALDVQCLHEHYGRDGTDYWPEHGFDHIEHGREVVSLPPGAGMCVRTEDGHVSCSGVGDELAPVPGVTEAIALGHGPNDSICALEASGVVACWPEELRAAHLGPGPALVTGATDAKQLAAGPDHACILRSDATVRCWGAWPLVGIGAVQTLDAPHAVQLPAHRHS